MAYDPSPFAFPQTPAVGPSGDLYHPADGYGPGMTLRDWFAGKAAAAILGGITASGAPTDASAAGQIAKAAYILADAMLAERSK